MKKKGLGTLLKELSIGQSLTTTQTPRVVYVTASRVGLQVSTEQTDKGTLVTVVGTKDLPKPKRSVLEMVQDLPITERQELFEHFELCCGYNRGSCMCKPEDEFVSPVIESVPVTVRATVGGPIDIRDLGGMNSSMAQFLEIQEPVNEKEAEPETVEEDDNWAFTKERPDYNANGHIYRRQWRNVSGKPVYRRVEVDEDEATVLGIID